MNMLLFSGEPLWCPPGDHDITPPLRVLFVVLSLANSGALRYNDSSGAGL